MTTIQPSVRTAAAADFGRAVATITVAFANDPVLRCVFPDPSQYLKYFPPVVQAFAGRAFEHESAHEVDDFRGVGLWLPPGVHPDEEKLGALTEEAIAKDRQEAVFGVLEQMGE